MGISPLSMRPAHSGRAWCVGLALASKSPGGYRRLFESARVLSLSLFHSLSVSNKVTLVMLQNILIFVTAAAAVM